MGSVGNVLVFIYKKIVEIGEEFKKGYDVFHAEK